MTFEDWVDRSIPMTDAEKTFAWFAWKAATKAEREACAKACDSVAEHYGPDEGYVADHCALEIRERSNSNSTT